MIKINFYLDGFQIEGHALYADSGSDIVCSAVSGISLGSINWFDKICKILFLEIDESKPIIKIKVELNKSSELGLALVETQLMQISESYKKYVSFKKYKKNVEA